MVSSDPTTEVELNYLDNSVSLHIVSDDLEIYALAKRLDDLATGRKELSSEKRRIIFLEINKSILEKVVRE